MKISHTEAPSLNAEHVLWEINRLFSVESMSASPPIRV